MGILDNAVAHKANNSMALLDGVFSKQVISRDILYGDST
jgi:hypothetical protein